MIHPCSPNSLLRYSPTRENIDSARLSNCWACEETLDLLWSVSVRVGLYVQYYRECLVTFCVLPLDSPDEMYFCWVVPGFWMQTRLVCGVCGALIVVWCSPWSNWCCSWCRQSRWCTQWCHSWGWWTGCKFVAAQKTTEEPCLLFHVFHNVNERLSVTLQRHVSLSLSGIEQRIQILLWLTPVSSLLNIRGHMRMLARLYHDTPFINMVNI